MKLPRIIALIGLLFAFAAPAHAQTGWASFQDTLSAPGNFQSTFKVGGGGFSKSIDIANDGTKLSTVDIWGAFVAQPGTSSVWTPLINETAFSAVTTCSNNNLPICWQGDGPYDARIAHSNSQIIFVYWDGQLWRSTNQGASFASVSGASGLPISTNTADTGGNSPVTWCGAGGGTARLSNPKTNIDPTQATLGSLTVIVPTARFGTYITKNGGSSFSLAGGIPTPFPSGGKTAATTSSTTSGAVLNFSGGPPAGLTTNYVAVDETHPFAIPPNTFYVSQTSNTVTLSNSVNSTVSSDDTIAFYNPGSDGCPLLQLVAFDPVSSSNIYVADPGSGILVSNNGGTTWAPTSGGTPPASTDVGTSMVVCRDERVYFVDQNNGFVYVYNPVTPAWTKTSQNGIWGIACDPSVTTGTVAAVGSSGGLFVSTDHGATWNSDEQNGSPASRVATDIPWLAITPEAMNASEIQYDPNQSQILYMAEGIGVWHTPVVNGGETTHTWTSQTAGIESLQGAGLVKSPSYTYPFMLYWDRAAFTTTNPNSYTAPAVQYQLSNTAGAGNAIVGGWSGDYASSNTATVCALANSNFGALTPISGCTSDGVNWTQFPVEPDMLPLVTSAGSAVSSATLTFSSVPIMIGDDLTRQMSDVGTIVFPAGTISSGSHSFAVASLPATVKVGDLVNTVGPGFLTDGAAGFQGTVGTQALIESIVGSTLTLNLNAGANISTSTMLQIQQPLQYKTNQSAPAANELCFSTFRGDINGITMTGTNVPHATVVSNITSGGACGAGEITVQLSNSLSVSDPGNTIFSFGLPNSPLPGQFLSASGNTSTTLHLGSAVAYPNAGSANTDGVRSGETIAFQAPPGSDMAVSSPTNIIYTREDNFSGAPFPLYTTDGGSTWNPAILCGSQCGTMAGFNSDGSASSNSCYAGGHGGFPHTLATDRVRATTFYVFNRCGHGNGTGIGVYRSTDGGVTWTRQFNDSPSGNVGFGTGFGLIPVPGQQDHVWFSNGNGFDGAHGNDTSGDLYRSCDGGATWFAVDATNLLNVAAFDFGAATPGGNGYPSVIIYGNVNGVWGVWRGDNPATTCANGQTVTWTKLSDQFLAGQLNLNFLIWLAADTTRYGYYYLNAGGGSAQGFHN